MFNGPVSIYNDKAIDFSNILPVGRPKLFFFLPSQIHEKLHYYEKQNPVPFLQAAVALADDVSVLFEFVGRREPILVQTDACEPLSKKPEEVANVSKKGCHHWVYTDIMLIFMHFPVLPFLHVVTLLF